MLPSFDADEAARMVNTESGFDEPTPAVAQAMLQMAKREPRRFWLNIYTSGNMFAHNSQESASNFKHFSSFVETVEVVEVLIEVLKD